MGTRHRNSKKGTFTGPSHKHNCWPHVVQCVAVLPAPTARHSPDFVCVCVCTCVLAIGTQGSLLPTRGVGSAGTVAGLSEVTGISLHRKIHSLD